MFLNYIFNDYKQRMTCDKCKAEALKRVIFNFNMDKNKSLRETLAKNNYEGEIEFKPLCLVCESQMQESFKIEIAEKQINGVFLKVRAL